MSITAAEIARMCNVSRTTVDRALKNKPGISEATRTQILAVAARYGYRPNYLASSLSTGQTRAVGIIVFDLYNQHFPSLVSAIEQYFTRAGIFSYICISRKDPARERSLIDSLFDRQVDGILLVPINDSAEFCAHLRGLNIPVVAMSNRLPGFPFVGGDNRTGAYTGMQDFYDRGYRTVYFVCPPLRRLGSENLTAQAERAEGYRQFMASHPDMRGDLIASADYLERVEALLRNAPEKPGIFCSSDLFMLAIRKRVIDLGWDLDARCVLMGFDGLEFLSQLSQRPSSIFYPAEAIGEAAARVLDDAIRGKPVPAETLLPCPLQPGTMRNAHS